jgi:hypothetical protein
MKAHEAAERAREGARRVRDNQIRVQTANGLQTTKIDVGNARIVFSDDKGELRLETNDGKKILTAKDPKGLLLFSGPVETQQDIDKLPPEVRKRYEQLQQSELPSVVNSQSVMSSEDEDDDGDSGDADDDDGDSDTPTAEQVSISPQAFPRSLLPLRTILI